MSLLRDRNVALLFGGETVSELGSTVTYLAFPLIAIGVLHASAFAVGVIAAAGNAAWLVVALPAGAYADRLRRRPILIAADLGSALLLASVPAGWALHLLSVPQLAVVAFGTSVLSVIFDVTYPAFLPSVLPAGRLVEGNGLMEAGANAARVAGPGLGGILVQTVGAPVTVLLDVATFLVSAVTIGAIRVSEAHVTPPGSAPRTKLRADIAAGLRHVLRSPSLRALVGAVTAANFVFGGYGAVVLVFLARQLGVAAGTIGLLVAVGSVGGIAGSLVAGPVARRIGDARLTWAVTAAVVASFAMIPLASRGPGLAWFAVGSFSLTVGITMFNVCVRAALQRSAPPALLGRITASTRLFSRGVLPIGALCGGALADAFTPRVALAVLAACYVAVPLRLRFSPLGRVRTLGDLAAGGPAPAPEIPEPERAGH